MFPLLWLLDLNCSVSDSCFPTNISFQSRRLFQGWQISWSHDLQILWIGDLHSSWSEAQGFVASLPPPAVFWRERSTRLSKVEPCFRSCQGKTCLVSAAPWSSRALPMRVSLLWVALARRSAQSPGQVVGDLPIRSEWSAKWVCPQNPVVCHFPQFFDDHKVEHH